MNASGKDSTSRGVIHPSGQVNTGTSLLSVNDINESKSTFGLIEKTINVLVNALSKATNSFYSSSSGTWKYMERVPNR